jgi:pimeloyl-ACP methyl ester carboxylesterase
MISNRTKKIAFLIVTLLLTARSFAQAEPLKYKAAVTFFETYYNSNLPDSIFSSFSPELKAALPQEKFNTTTTQLKSQIGSLLKTEFVKYNQSLAIYKATFQNATFLLNISLNSKNQFKGLVLSPYQDKALQSGIVDPSITESPVLLKTLGGAMSGTLAMPTNAKGKIPVVLIIAGSGPVDRDGNSAKLNLATNDYKLIAESLGKNGIASLRYDKRLVGESIGTTKEDELHFDDYTDDALGFVNLLKADERFSKVIVLGHSEGSLVGILAAIASEGSVNALISVEGAGESADKVLTEQMKSQPEYIADGFKTILDSLRKAKFTKKVDPALYFVARPSIQMFLLTWCRFDPAREIKKLKIPTLIIQGTTDLQVNVSNAEKLKKGKSNSTVAIIEGMNHVLKEAPADRQQNLATYTKPDLPLKPEFVTSVVDFIKGLK